MLQGESFIFQLFTKHFFLYKLNLRVKKQHVLLLESPCILCWNENFTELPRKQVSSIILVLRFLKRAVLLDLLFFQISAPPNPASFVGSRTVQVMSMATLSTKGLSLHIYCVTVQTQLNSLCSVREQVDSLCITRSFAVLNSMPLSESPSCNLSNIFRNNTSFINNRLNTISCIHKQSLKYHLYVHKLTT